MLVVAPLHGRGNKGGVGAGVKLLAYTPPTDPLRDQWQTELLDDSLHVTHNFDLGQWDREERATAAEEIAYLGREGAMIIRRIGSGWTKEPLIGVQGGGEIRMGRIRRSKRFMATIEPFHGDKLVVYEYGSNDLSKAPHRSVLADDLSQGHAIATGDLLGQGTDQIVVGWRNRNPQGEFGIRLYTRSSSGAWTASWVDRNGIACEDLRVDDLDGDGDLDIVASGRSTHNLKIYWNLTVN